MDALKASLAKKGAATPAGRKPAKRAVEDVKPAKRKRA